MTSRRSVPRPRPRPRSRPIPISFRSWPFSWFLSHLRLGRYRPFRQHRWEQRPQTPNQLPMPLTFSVPILNRIQLLRPQLPIMINHFCFHFLTCLSAGKSTVLIFLVRCLFYRKKLFTNLNIKPMSISVLTKLILNGNSRCKDPFLLKPHSLQIGICHQIDVKKKNYKGVSFDQH